MNFYLSFVIVFLIIIFMTNDGYMEKNSVCSQSCMKK